jgi:hypothetical protein
MITFYMLSLFTEIVSLQNVYTLFTYFFNIKAYTHKPIAMKLTLKLQMFSVHSQCQWIVDDA